MVEPLKLRLPSSHFAPSMHTSRGLNGGVTSLHFPSALETAMKSVFSLLALTVVALFMAGCASTPQTPETLWKLSAPNTAPQAGTVKSLLNVKSSGSFAQCHATDDNACHVGVQFWCCPSGSTCDYDNFSCIVDTIDHGHCNQYNCER
jgi:hypothetical protein